MDNVDVTKIQWSLLLSIILLLSACSTIIKPEQPSTVDFINLNSENQIGQSFLSRFDGLNGIRIHLSPKENGEGIIKLSLLTSSMDSAVLLAESTLRILEINEPRYHRFSFNELIDSTNEDYYLLLEMIGDGSVQIGVGPADSYLSGSAYLDGKPTNNQLAFQLSYEQKGLILGLLQEGIYWLNILFASAVLIIIPGYGILSTILDKWNQYRWPEKYSLASGVSIAIYPILFLYSNLFHIQLGFLYALLLPLLGLVLIIWKNYQPIKLLADRSTRSKYITGIYVSSLNYLKTPRIFIPDLVLLLIIGLVFTTRFWPIRNLDAPMWGDSFQHTMIAQLIVDNNGLFNSWKPYTELATFTYHFGFHSLVATFHWLTNIPLPQSTLWVGQVINAFAVFSLYPVSLLISKNRWSGIVTLLIAGLLLPIPMYYVNWGRYTQLTGLLILATWVFLAWKYFNGNMSTKRMSFLVGSVLAGMALSHYRVLIFAILFLPSFYILYAKKIFSLTLIRKFFLISIISLALCLPWIINAFGGNLPDILAAQLTSQTMPISNTMEQLNSIGDVWQYVPKAIWVLTFLVIVWGILKRNRNVMLISLWWLLILVSANPQWLRLPGQGALSNFAVFIAAYFPVSLFLGAGTAMIIALAAYHLTKLGRYTSQIKTIAIRALVITSTLILFGYLGIWGVKQRINNVDPDGYALLTRPDINASYWIADNLPSNSNFLVNAFFAYGGTSVVGSDGGWWLPLVANHQTMLPPLNYVAEEGYRSDYYDWVNSLVAEIEAKGIDHPDVVHALDERGITHVYIGQRQGAVNSQYPLLPVEQLLASPHFGPIYHQDRVWIFERIPT